MQGFSDSNNPAFPTTWTIESISGPQEVVMRGLTKREYFAALAMQGFASNPDWAKTMSKDDWDEYRNRLSNAATELADALILELEK